MRSAGSCIFDPCCALFCEKSLRRKRTVALNILLHIFCYMYATPLFKYIQVCRNVEVCVSVVS
jgi:hypothetical protein